jgi:ribosomal protein L40E
MDPPNSAPWTFAARAAYFGDRMCPFCDHRNPGGAKFCNDCGSPLDLKPCSQCSAVNHQSATTCYQCGADYPASSTPPEATPAWLAADAVAASGIPEEVGGAANVMQTQFAAKTTFRVGWGLVAITLLVAGIYAVYCANVATPDVTGVAFEPIGAGERNAPITASDVPMVVESNPAKTEAAASLENTTYTALPEVPERVSVRQRPLAVSAARRVSAHQRPVPELHPRVRATPRVAQVLAAAPVGAGADIHKSRGAEPWQAMHVSLARCGGHLIAHIACDQRVRRRLCERHWGEVPECANGIPNDHGQ